MRPKLSIVDYGMGNIFSIKCALDSVNINSIFTNNIEEIKKTDGIILPGVGAFPEAIKRLKKNKIPNIIEEFHKKNKLIIGICLGMQLLFETSYELKKNTGLSLIKGEVVKFKKNYMNVGWSEIDIAQQNSQKESLLTNDLNKKHMYFIHSYHSIPKDKNMISSTSNFHREKFVSSIKSQNLFTFQFHPEKSGRNGMKIYKEIEKKLI
tara:strand:- start:1798 stop:2421 length:624 start_codon:yes stop_codon:yes gene_type:complete